MGISVNGMEGRLALTTLVVVVSVICLGNVAGKEVTLVKVDDDNWSQILEGEWMVEFFAPWCPACRSLQPVWEDFSSWGRDLGIQVGQVDITNSPGLSGRFMITALPTIFHVKEGVFRQYKGPRSKEEFLSYVEEKKWEQVEPISTWQSPTSIQMSLISQFYKVSMSIRNLMNVMLEQYGIPAWAAYVIFGLATIVLGLLLGLILVCIIDFVYPPSHSRAVQSGQSGSAGATSKKSKDSDDELTEEIQDDKSQAESEGESQREEDDDQGGSGSSPGKATRRRRVRKAD